jgi:cobalamin synthase
MALFRALRDRRNGRPAVLAAVLILALAALTAALIMAIDKATDNWVAALIVAAVYAAIAGILALQGRNKVREAVPPAPEQTVESVKEDVQWAKTRTQSARR